MKKLNTPVSLCIIYICCFSWINSEEQKIQIVTEDWAPYNYIENGSLTGFSVDVVNELMNIMGKSMKSVYIRALETRLNSQMKRI